jgi:hypothetical protein
MMLISHSISAIWKNVYGALMELVYIITEQNWSTRKDLSQCHFVHQISHGLAWVCTWSSDLRGQSLTIWAMAQPFIFPLNIN